MPNYRYICNKCEIDFREFACVDDRDKVVCPTCAELATRIFEGTTAFKWEHRSNAEKAIHRDLVEANNLEKAAAYKGMAPSEDDQRKLSRELDKLKFTD
jgi:putative FmdB family regulatory protein